MTTAERRRGIELVLDTRPEIDLDDLQRILAKVGIEVDTDTLVEDLDALGFDVDDPVDGPVGDTEDVEGTEGDAFADRPARAPRAEAVASTDGDGDDPGDGVWSRPTLVIAAAVVVVVILAALFLAGGGDDDEQATGTGDPSETVTAGGGATEQPGPTEPVPVAPAGPGSDPALDVPETLTDDFERGDVGDFPGVATWELLSGEWLNTDGNLDLASLLEDEAAVAAVDVGTGDVRAQVQVDRRASRAGIAFRIVDERNFFVWATVPEYATNILFHVVDGDPTPVADSGLTTTGDGLPALGINLVGDRAELLNDGVVVATYDGIGPADGATRIGVAVLSGTGEPPLFDDVKVLRPPA